VIDSHGAHQSSVVVRLLVVALVGVLSAASFASTVIHIRRPNGQLGLQFEDGFTITGVVPNSPAAQAGIRPGDVLVAKYMSQAQRALVFADNYAFPGEPVLLSVRHGQELRRVRIVLSSPPLTAQRTFAIALGALNSLAFFVVAGALVMLRPSRTTWAFLLVAACNPGIFAGLSSPPLPETLNLARGLLLAGLSAAFVGGLLIFAARFPEGAPRGWRVWLDRGAVPFAALVFVLNLCGDWFDLFSAQSPPAWFVPALRALSPIIAVVVALAFLSTYFSAGGAERQRVKWVIATFTLTLGIVVVSAVLHPSGSAAQMTLAIVGELATISIPLAIAYAVLRHRVLDVNFVISRALVFAVLTAAIVALLTSIEFFVGRVLEQTRLAVVADIAAAIGIGFWLNSVHAALDRFLERVLFRRRHEAQVHLERISAGLPHAESRTVIDRSMVREPMGA